MKHTRVPASIILSLLVVVFTGSPISADERLKSEKYAIVIHGGAGRISNNKEWRESSKKVLEKALSTGVTMLKSGKTSLDTVEAVVRIPEDSPYFNAGKGAVCNAKGNHELDATIMDGRDRSVGAVDVVSTVKNPISLARRVMTDTRHVLLVTQGVEEFADRYKNDPAIERVPNSYFSTGYRRRSFQEIRKKQNMEETDAMETVGCVALDRHGNLAAATSTGGLTNKKFGRLGDSLIAGAGTFADNKTCGVSCTGIGEDFIRYAVAFDVSARMAYRGDSLKKAIGDILTGKTHRVRGGIIAIDSEGKIVMHFNTPGMSRATGDSDGRHEVHIGE